MKGSLILTGAVIFSVGSCVTNAVTFQMKDDNSKENTKGNLACPVRSRQSVVANSETDAIDSFCDFVVDRLSCYPCKVDEVLSANFTLRTATLTLATTIHKAAITLYRDVMYDGEKYVAVCELDTKELPALSIGGLNVHISCVKYRSVEKMYPSCRSSFAGKCAIPCSAGLPTTISCLTDDKDMSLNSAVLVGGVVGAVIGCLVIVSVIVVWRNRRRRNISSDSKRTPNGTGYTDVFLGVGNTVQNASTTPQPENGDAYEDIVENPHIRSSNSLVNTNDNFETPVRCPDNSGHYVEIRDEDLNRADDQCNGTTAPPLNWNSVNNQVCPTTNTESPNVYNRLGFLPRETSQKGHAYDRIINAETKQEGISIWKRQHDLDLCSTESQDTYNKLRTPGKPPRQRLGSYDRITNMKTGDKEPYSRNAILQRD